MGQRPVACADEAYKSYGVLKYARRLTRKDAMEFLSQIMAGPADGILKMKEPCSVYGLMLGIQPANLLSQAERPMSREELDALHHIRLSHGIRAHEHRQRPQG